MVPLLYRYFIISFSEICKFKSETGRYEKVLNVTNISEIGIFEIDSGLHEQVLSVINGHYDFRVSDA